MGKLLCILASLLACLSLNAQNPCAGCWGKNDTSATLTTQDKKTLRLYSKLQWYDFSTYRFKGSGKRAVWISYAIAGILHGGREAYHAEPTAFEKRFNAAPQSWFGSEQWKRQYYNRDPENMPHKPNIWNPLRDYYHFSGTGTKYLLIGGAVTIGASKQPTKYKIIDTLIAFAGFSATASLTYTLLR